MNTSRLFTLTIVVLLIAVLRDFIGASVFWSSPFLSTTLMRLFDAIYFGYAAYGVRLCFTYKVFTGFQKKTFFILAVLVGISLIHTSEIAAFLRSTREVLLPSSFLIYGAIIGCDPGFHRARSRVSFWILFGTLGCSIAIGAVQMVTIHDAKDYWYYEYMVKNNLYLDESINFIRNDIARGTGFGMSPFSLGYFGLGLAMFALMDYQLYPRCSSSRPVTLKFAAIVVAGLASCFVSNSRLALASLIFLLLFWKSRVSPKIAIPMGVLIAALFGPAFVEYLQDASFSGRFVQWGAALLDGTVLHPFGSAIASGPSGIWFDSYILNFLTSFGVLSLVCYVVLIGSFSPKVLSRIYIFSFMFVLVIQALIQALEYCPFIPLSLLALGFYFGNTRRTAMLPPKPTGNSA
jgi:hypothetical protein